MLRGPAVSAFPRKAFRSFLPLFAFLAGVSILVAEELYPRTNPHQGFANARVCERCHIRANGRIAEDRFAIDSDEYCYECHPKSTLGRTHPTGSRPSARYGNKMTVPEDFRLDDGGRLMCLTCHMAHGPAYAKTKAFPHQKPSEGSGDGAYYKTLFLRRTGSKDGFAALCNECHRKL